MAWSGKASLGRVVLIDSMTRRFIICHYQRCLKLQLEVCIRPIEIGVSSNRLFGEHVDSLRFEPTRLV